MTSKTKIPSRQKRAKPNYSFTCDPTIMADFDFLVGERDRSTVITEALTEYCILRKLLHAELFTWLLNRSIEKKISLMSFIAELLNKSFRDSALNTIDHLKQSEKVALSQIRQSARKQGKILNSTDCEAILIRAMTDIATDPQIWDKAVAEYNPSNYAVTAA